MSQNIIPIKTLRTKPTILEASQNPEYLVKIAGQANTYVQIANSSASNSSITWSFTPPSGSTVIDSKIYMLFKATITFTNTITPAPPPGSSPIIGYALDPSKRFYVPTGTDGFRRFPFSQVMQNASITINGVQSSVQMQYIIDALTRYGTYMDDNNFEYSVTPNMPDKSQKYGDLLGGNLNPLAGYPTNSEYSHSRGYTAIHNGVPPGNFGCYMLSAPTPTSATIYIRLAEPLFISPLSFGKAQYPGFSGISSMAVNITFGDLTRIWSHDAVNGQVITNITVDIDPYGQLLLMHYVSAPLSLVPRADHYIYPYYNVIDNITTLGVTSYGSLVTDAISNNIQLPFIPSRIYVYLKKSNSTLTYNDTDSFARITGIDINFNNRSGQLNSATPIDLYRICVKNGIKMTWDEWYNHIGGVICIDFGSDLAMGPGEAPGLPGQWNLQISVTAYNINNVEIIYDFHVVAISAGSMTIYESGGAQQKLGLITTEAVLNSPDLPLESMVINFMEDSIYGGYSFSDFTTGVKKFFNGLLNAGKGAVKKAGEFTKGVLTGLADILAPISDLAQTVAGPLELANAGLSTALTYKTLKNFDKLGMGGPYYTGLGMAGPGMYSRSQMGMAPAPTEQL